MSDNQRYNLALTRTTIEHEEDQDCMRKVSNLMSQLSLLDRIKKQEKEKSEKLTLLQRIEECNKGAFVPTPTPLPAHPHFRKTKLMLRQQRQQEFEPMVTAACQQLEPVLKKLDASFASAVDWLWPKSVDMSTQPSAPTVPSSTAPPVNPFAAPLAQPSVPAKSSLSFNFTAPPLPAASKAEAQPTTANDSSLLLRMGGFSAPSQAAAAPVAAITTPARSFWSNPTTTSTATVAVPTSASSNVSAPANFSFGGISTPTPSSVPAAPPPVNASKPSIMFSFAPTTQAAPSVNSKPASSSKPAAQPLKFTFNGIGNGSSKPFSVPFGAPPVNQQATLGAATSAAPLFGVKTASTLDTNGTAGPAFGGPSQFGASSTVATGSAFGTGSSTTPNGTPAAKSAFTFGPSTPFGAPSTPSSYSTSISVFGQPPATQNGTPAANSAFTFGAPSTPTTNTTASSAFGLYVINKR
ncbi:hypothetical protein BC835DRAFT_1410963 [Cytidiella melzeri]|nr:hypothetical protein BC835DRAFT_1410963 [Cytidiella melzeri]